MSDLVGNPEDRFSRVAAHIMSKSMSDIKQLSWITLVLGEFGGKVVEPQTPNQMVLGSKLCCVLEQDTLTPYSFG